jgi:hypothetical protein
LLRGLLRWLHSLLLRHSQLLLENPLDNRTLRRSAHLSAKLLKLLGGQGRIALDHTLLQRIHGLR